MLCAGNAADELVMRDVLPPMTQSVQPDILPSTRGVPPASR